MAESFTSAITRAIHFRSMPKHMEKGMAFFMRPEWFAPGNSGMRSDLRQGSGCRINCPWTSLDWRFCASSPGAGSRRSPFCYCTAYSSGRCCADAFCILGMGITDRIYGSRLLLPERLFTSLRIATAAFSQSFCMISLSTLHLLKYATLRSIIRAICFTVNGFSLVILGILIFSTTRVIWSGGFCLRRGEGERFYLL